MCGESFGSETGCPTSPGFRDAGCRALQRVHLQKLAESASRRLQARDHVLAILRDSRGLIVQLIQNKLWRKMVLMDEELVCRLTNHAVLLETALRKMLRVLGEDRVSASHDGSS